MRHVIVRYTVKPERAAENEELVRAVYSELHDITQVGSYRLFADSNRVHVSG
jgi:hypothetical protein